MKSGQLMRQVINKINEVDFNNLTERQHFGDIYEQILNDLQNAGNAGEYYTPAPSPPSWSTASTPSPAKSCSTPPAAPAASSPAPSATCASATSSGPRTRRDAGRRCARWRRSSCRTCSASPTCCCTASRTRASSATTTRWRALHQLHQADRVDIVLTNPPFGGKRGGRHREQLPQPSAPANRRPVPRPDHPPAQARRPRRRGAARRLAVRRGRQDPAQGTPDGGVQPAHHRAAAQQVFKPYASIGTNLLFFEKGEPTKDIWFYEHRVPEGRRPTR
jgi:type I restriction enzyme M protein